MFFRITLLALLVAAASAAEVAEKNLGPTPGVEVESVTAAAINTTTAPPPTHPPTTPPTTAPTTPAPTTPAPTPVPTTPAPTPAPTTPAPTPTPTPSPQPTPAPAPPAQWVVVDDKTHQFCILANLSIRFDIPYNTTDNKIEIVTIELPKNASATGHCGKEDQLLGLHWNKTNYIAFTFKLNQTSHNYFITSIMANITADPSIFKKSAEKVGYYLLAHNRTEFSTRENNTYECKVAQDLVMNVANQVNKTAKIDFTFMKLNAFRTDKKSPANFDSSLWCDAGQTPDIVPIVVGCVLAALVILVLVGYLIGRRRSQARGYLSM